MACCHDCIYRKQFVSDPTARCAFYLWNEHINSDKIAYCWQYNNDGCCKAYKSIKDYKVSFVSGKVVSRTAMVVTQPVKKEVPKNYEVILGLFVILGLIYGFYWYCYLLYYVYSLALAFPK